MQKNVQHLRRSQFIYTFGPGAIMEGLNGPRLIPNFKYGLQNLFNSIYLERLEISDTRLKIAIKNLIGQNIRIFLLPSNESLRKSQNSGIYKTYIFPTWKICYGRAANHPVILYNMERCPLCNDLNNASTVRFVLACTNGHLDEVNWQYAVHRNSSNKKCNPNYYYWNAGGTSLSNIKIKCPQCKNEITMEEIYQINFKCTGRFPEKEIPIDRRGQSPYYPRPRRPFRNKCDRSMKVIQRQSSSLRIPETITLLTIPEFDNSITRILQIEKIAAALRTIMNLPTINDMERNEIVEWLIRSLRGVVSNDTLTIIINYINDNCIGKLFEIYNKLYDENKTFIDFIYQEFESLIEEPINIDYDNFKMLSPTEIPKINNIPELLVYPIEKIRTVTTQIGYRRVPTTKNNEQPELIKIGGFLDEEYWYPGFEGFGEGIFIKLKNEEYPNIEDFPAFKEWNKNSQNINNINNYLWGNLPINPYFIWYHTLSHSIIETLSLYSGYSSASLRERVYISRNGKNGGILIYTTSPGEDASMGGLLNTIEIFDKIITVAYLRIQQCSNDPLCHQIRKSSSMPNGSACYSCLLISETSCEHRNMWLDRHIILGD